jgi:hypothetical protein
LTRIGSPVPGAGTEGREWIDLTPPIISRGESYETVERTIQIPMRDGILLTARIIEPLLPQGSALPPGIVVTNGYGALDVALLPSTLPSCRTCARWPATDILLFSHVCAA